MKKYASLKIGKNMLRLYTILLIATITLSVLATVPTSSAWVDGRVRAPWTKEARNYWNNYIHWWYTSYRGVPFMTYMLWDDVGERADEYAYNASRAVTVDDVRMGLYDQYVGLGFMTAPAFWGNLSIFEANAATYGAPSNWQVNGSQSVPPTYTYVEVNETVFFTTSNLTSTNFNVSVYVQNVTNMGTCGIKLGYNASMLEAVRVYPGAVPASFGGFGAGTWVPVNASMLFNPAGHPVINNTRRYTPDWSPLDSTTYAYVWVAFVGPLGWTFSGTGEVFKIEFHIIDAPPVHTVPTPSNASIYTYLDLWETEVRDNLADWINHAPLDGRYTYIRPQPVGVPPTAVCSVTPSTVYVGDNVTFDSAGSSDGGAPPLTYAWDIGSDGSVEYTTPTAVYTTTTAGTFNVTLTVTNALNLTDSTTCYWNVLTPGPPTAEFTWTRTYPTVNETVYFNASASIPNGGNITSYAWDFGDGTNGTGMIVNHTYSAAGPYNVTLNVTDTEGWDTVSHILQVVKRPYVSLNPQNYTAPTVGHTFTIDINITDVTDLYGFEFKLWYNTTILNAEVVEGPFLKTGGLTDAILTVHEPEGYISGTVTLTGNVQGVNGSGILVKINFTATALGNSTLHLNETILRDHLNATIPHDIVPAGLVQGQIRVIPEFPATMIILLLLIATAVAILLKKKISRQGSHTKRHTITTTK